MSLVPTIAAPNPRRAPARRPLPQIAALWMERAGERLARIELRIERPSAAPDWAIRRIEWLEPAQAAICLHPDERARRVLDAAMRPGDAQGRWFAGDPSLFVRYPSEDIPAHRVALRLHLVRRSGRRASLEIATTFPALARSAEVLAFERRSGPPGRA
jgi:hypothetical protein